MWLSGEESSCQCKRHGLEPWARKSPWRRKWQPTPVFLSRKSHGQKSLEGYSPCGCKESDRAEHASMVLLGCSDGLTTSRQKTYTDSQKPAVFNNWLCICWLTHITLRHFLSNAANSTITNTCTLSSKWVNCSLESNMPNVLG